MLLICYLKLKRQLLLTNFHQAKIRKSHLQVLQMVSKVHQVKGEVKVTDISKG